MAIKLRVISDQYRELGEQRSRVFGVNGGTIGRAPDNDWVLPDQKRLVSGHHCDIEYRSGGYWLRDRSTNGVFINESDEAVSESGPVPLQDGDRLRLGDYEILVSVDERMDFLPAESELESAEQHLDSGIGVKLDLDSLFKPRDSGDSSSISIRNAFGLKLPKSFRKAAREEQPVETSEPQLAPPLEDPPIEGTPGVEEPVAAAEARARQSGRRRLRRPRARNLPTPSHAARVASTPGSRHSRSTSRRRPGRTCARPCRRSVAAQASTPRRSARRRSRCCRSSRASFCAKRWSA